MVEISEITEEVPQQQPQPAATTTNAADLRSQERLLDADEIEAALQHITRPSAQLHLENIITKLRKEGKALQRVAASKAATLSSSSSEDATATAPPQAATAAPSAAVPVPKRAPAKPPITSKAQKYQSFPTYYFDAGKYNSQFVTVYVPLENIGQHDKSKIECQFTSGSFDLVVLDYNGKSYRLLNDNLEKDIDVTKSKVVVKPNKIIIKLGKIMGEFGSYDSWQQLTAKNKSKSGGGKSGIDGKNPQAGIMDMMKNMYDEGDDSMKKMIGETMLKQQNGQLNSDSMGMGGMGDMMGGMGM